MQLIYHGQVFNYTPALAQPDVTPQAVNWRFQIPGASYGEKPPVRYVSREPRAVNWRFRIGA